MTERFTYGGFLFENIKKALVEECYISGDPLNYFMALQEVMEELSDEFEDGILFPDLTDDPDYDDGYSAHEDYL